MEITSAIISLSALGHEGRLSIYRLLVQAGPEGIAAGEIARRLTMIPSTLSASLNVLSQAGLIHARRDGRSIVYRANDTAMTTLLNFLINDCGGRSEFCAPLTATLAQAAGRAGAFRAELELELETTMTEQASRRPLNILFLCTHNSARSILAEAIVSRVGAGRFQAYSAGWMPSGHINAQAMTLLHTLNYQTGSLYSKNWGVFSKASNPDAPELDFVFTVCDNAAGEICPAWSGQPMTAHWSIPDPAAATGTPAEVALIFAETYRQLYSRITAFCALPMAALDRLSLQHRLDDIGKPEASGTATA